jgi:predicted TPR repeat methyltransferase
MRKAVAASDDPSEAYGALTTLLCRAGRLDEAAEVFGQWHVAQPDNPVAAHMVAALTGGESPERASDAYLREEFDGFAEQFETVLAKLDYQAPQLVQPLVEKYAPQPCTKILDAGCGTGLCAPFLRPRTETLVGVDLSTKMLEVAAKRDAYDELVESELTAYLRSNPSAFDCIVATDVLIYFGRLEELVGGFAGALRPGGLLAISLEEAATGVDEYRLNPGGRYEHSEAYSRRTLSEAGLELIALERAILRRERNEDVGGMIVAARVP